MSVVSRLCGWLRRAKRRRAPENPTGLLREFVYLDEVSVYSILASRKGGIAAEFTESQTASLSSEVGGLLSVGVDSTKAKLDSKLQASQVQGSQVLRKAVIQTSFKELYDIEHASLALSLPDPGRIPTVRTVVDLQEILKRPDRSAWIIDPSTIRRGELLEVEVELHADPIFRMASIITTLQELVEDNEQLFGNDVFVQLPQMRSMARVLESLLVGLVPIRGRLVDYRSARIDGRDVLIHHLLLEGMPSDNRPKALPVFVVGVAERDLFWKDIRRILFSQAQYTIFCRLARAGVADKWRPVKVADVLAGIVPQFDEMVREFSEKASQAMIAKADVSAASAGEDERSGMCMIKAYTELLVTHHNGTLDLDVIDEVILSISPERDWLSSVDGRRAVFLKVTQLVEEKLGVETSGEVIYDLRNTAMNNTGLTGAKTPKESRGGGVTTVPAPGGHERFLDTEIVAIYW